MRLECVSSGTIRKFEQILCQFKEETRRLSSAKSRVDDAEMAQKMPKLQIKEFLRHILKRSSNHVIVAAFLRPHQFLQRNAVEKLVGHIVKLAPH